MAKKKAAMKKAPPKKAPKKQPAKKKAVKKAAKPVRCAGKTKAGKRCKSFASGRSKFCAAHKRK